METGWFGLYSKNEGLNDGGINIPNKNEVGRGGWI